MERNIKLYKLYSAFSDLLFIGPVLVLYMLGKGLTFAEVMALQSVFSIGIVILEVPTGATADKFGRKNVLLLSSLFQFIGVLMLILGNSFFTIALAELAFAVGISLKSGTDSALIYDTTLALGISERYQDLLGSARAYLLVSQALASLVAGFLYKLSPDLPFILCALFVLINGLLAMFFKEAPITKEGKYGLGYYAQIKNSLVHTFTHKKIVAVLLFASSYLVFSKVGFWLYQPYFKETGIDVIYFGFLFFAFNMVAALASKFNAHFIRLTRGYTMTAVNLLIVISFAMLASIPYAFGVIFILLQQTARGFYMPVVNKYINKHTSSDKRATVLSVVSLVSNLSSAILLPIFGLVMDKSNVFITHALCAILLFFFSVLLHFIVRRLHLSIEKV